jgi:hypothetical protein
VNWFGDTVQDRGLQPSPIDYPFRQNQIVLVRTSLIGIIGSHVDLTSRSRVTSSAFILESRHQQAVVSCSPRQVVFWALEV